MTPDSHLPPQFRRKAFDRYVDVFHKLVTYYPNPVIIDPERFGLSAVTVASRLRDAKRSLLEHEWDKDLAAKVRAIDDDLEVSHDSATGMIAIKSKTKPAIQATTVIAAADGLAFHFFANDMVSFDPLMKDVIIATVCRLAHNKCLSRKILLPLDEADADRLYESYDINLEPVGDGNYILT